MKCLLSPVTGGDGLEETEVERLCGRFLWSEQACWYLFFNFVVVCTPCAFLEMSASFPVCLCVCRLSCFNALTQAEHALMRGGSNCFKKWVTKWSKREITGLNDDKEVLWQLGNYFTKGSKTCID